MEVNNKLNDLIQNQAWDQLQSKDSEAAIREIANPILTEDQPPPTSKNDLKDRIVEWVVSHQAEFSYDDADAIGELQEKLKEHFDGFMSENLDEIAEQLKATLPAIFSDSHIADQIFSFLNRSDTRNVEMTSQSQKAQVDTYRKRINPAEIKKRINQHLSVIEKNPTATLLLFRAEAASLTNPTPEDIEELTSRFEEKLQGTEVLIKFWIEASLVQPDIFKSEEYLQKISNSIQPLSLNDKMNIFHTILKALEPRNSFQQSPRILQFFYKEFQQLLTSILLSNKIEKYSHQIIDALSSIAKQIPQEFEFISPLSEEDLFRQSITKQLDEDLKTLTGQPALQQSLSAQSKIGLNLLLAEILRNSGHKIEAESYLQRAESIIRQEAVDPSFQSELLSPLIECFINMENVDYAASLVNEFEPSPGLFQKVGLLAQSVFVNGDSGSKHQMNRAIHRGLLGLGYTLQNDGKRAEKEFKLADKEASRIQKASRRAEAYAQLGIIRLKCGQDDQAKAYLQKVLHIHEQEERSVTRTLSVLITHFAHEGWLEEARDYSMKLEPISAAWAQKQIVAAALKRDNEEYAIKIADAISQPRTQAEAYALISYMLEEK